MNRRPLSVRDVLRLALAVCAACAAMTATKGARAWYFPEHSVIAKDALVELPREVRAVLRTAVGRARAEGLSICEDLEISLENLPRTKPLESRMLHAEAGAPCVPYATIPAIAGDHADHTRELRAVLSSQKGLELTTAAAYEWDRFLRAVERLPNTSLERMSFVHELDVDFYFIDPGYELRAQATRSHFADAGRNLETILRGVAAAGATDNAVGQFVAHHLRSLQRAVLGDVTEAVLEHAFAVHFLEDSFSAGHLVMTDALWAKGNARARRRHDFFDAKGLPVVRAASPEPCEAMQSSFESDLLPCWVTTGDGHLGIHPDSSDRRHVARAVEKAEMAFALALDPTAIVGFIERLGERELIAVGDLLDPMPWWMLRTSDRRRAPSSASHASRLVRGAAAAVLDLRRRPPIAAVDVGAVPRTELFDLQIAQTAADPCIAPGEASTDTPIEDDGCGAGRVLAVGTAGTSLLRPVLVDVPRAREDVSKLEGEASIDHGFAIQLLASAGGNALFARGASIDFYAPAVSVSMGLAYRFGTYLPGRRNRAAFELNAGIAEALHYDSRGHAGGNPNTTMLVQELRWPILWERFTSYVLPLDLRKSKEAGSVIVLGGVRVHELLSGPTPQLWGIDFETVAFALGNGRGAYPLYSASPEIRVHFGVADPSAAQPSLPRIWAPTVGITFIGGYTTFL